MEIKIEKVTDVKPGKYIYVNGKVYKVVNVETAKTGKHGAAKARIEAISFDGDKIILVKPTQDPIEVPVIIKRRGQVISKISDDMVMVMDSETFETFEARVPDELKDKISEGDNVIVWDIGEKVIMQRFRD